MTIALLIIGLLVVFGPPAYCLCTNADVKASYPGGWPPPGPLTPEEEK